MLGLPLLSPPSPPPAQPSAERALSVTLVLAPEEKPARKSGAVADAAVADEPRATPAALPREDIAAAAPAGELHVAEAAPPARGATEPRARPRALPRPPEPKPALPRAGESEEEAAAARAFIAGTAIYNVAVDAKGSIAGIELLQSSGTAAFDAAGETMIRTTMESDRPAAETAFTVTIRFTPEGAALAQ